ncbi:LysR family transcriptional regulator (plasmid) [Agrobacterium tumefaciens]|uniref:HTH-type transcriptional regulator TtuA n=1 Tax=Agrobacterium tumefaciens TaxID=358 RepID=A0AAJ4TDF1_AGRTU|nr:LysR family transcriptional regulator [Agrobacterium tumefaciens]
MTANLDELGCFVEVARARSFRDAARRTGVSPSTMSAGVQRLEDRLGVRLLNRTTRSVTPTEVGERLLERLVPVLGEIEAALDVVNAFRDTPMGTLRLNVPLAAARLVLPPVIEPFLKANPNIRLDLTVEDSFVDILAAGADAGIRYDDRLEKDMVAVPIGPRIQRYALAAAPAYLEARGVPKHPKDLLNHACIRGRFPSGALAEWEFERDGKTTLVDPSPSFVVSTSAIDNTVSAAIAGLGLTYLFEDLVAPAFADGSLVPVLESWWAAFSGPFLYYPSRTYMPGALRAFVDHVKQVNAEASAGAPSDRIS